MKSLKFLAFAVAFGFMLSASAEEHLKSLNPAYFDKSTPAGEDFYKHVNKGWQESHPLTPEHARYGNFNILSDSSEARVKDIVLNLGATNPQPGSVAFKVWTIYSQAMDSVRRNAEAQSPSLPTSRKSKPLPPTAWRTSSCGCTPTMQAPSSAPAPWRISPTARCMPCM